MKGFPRALTARELLVQRSTIQGCALLCLGSALCPDVAAQSDSAIDALGVEVHGFVSQGFIYTSSNQYLADSERGSFEFTEVGLNFTKSVSDNLRLGMQLFTRDLGPIGNYRAQFDWFYLDYRFFDWLGVRAGRTKLPWGLYNETRDVDSAHVPILLPQGIYPLANRDYLLAQNGAELYGYVRLSHEAGALDYRLYAGTIFPDADTPNLELSIPYIAGGRLLWLTPLAGLQIGFTAEVVRLEAEFTPPAETLAAAQEQGLLPADFGGSVELEVPYFLSVASVEYIRDRFSFAAEYFRGRARLESSHPALFPNVPPLWVESFYGMASYQVAPWFTPGVYYSLSYPDVKKRRGRANYQHDLALSLRYDLTPNWLLKLEGHYMVGTSGLSSELNDGKPLDQLTRQWGVFLAKTTAYF